MSQHTTLEARIEAAREGAARMQLRLPMLVDGMDDAVSKAFAAWPERIYVARSDGILDFVGGPGPYAFDPDSAGDALALLLANA